MTRTLRLPLSALLALLLTACASFPSKEQLSYRPGVSIERVTRIAAQAMLSMNFTPMRQNESQGYVMGVLEEKDPMGFRTSYYLTVQIVRQPDTSLQVNVEARAGREVAISDKPGKHLAEFRRVFDRMMEEALANPVQRAPVPRKAPTRSNEYRL